jgi:hypothetical protein
MRSPAIVSLLLLCGWANTADARLFWQTYGSTELTAAGCQWNTNSDYFVPRHCDTCRYGLFSPCKTSCTTSPACRREHAIYAGYCSPYGCLHYCRFNHVYARKCGCCPVPYYGPIRPACGHLCERCWHGGVCLHGNCSQGTGEGVIGTYEACVNGLSVCASGMCPAAGYPADNCECLANVESAEFQILGSISLSGDPLLSSLQLGGPAMGMPLTPGAMIPMQAIPGTMPAPTAIPGIPKIPADPQAIPVYSNPELEHGPNPSVSPNLE